MGGEQNWYVAGQYYRAALQPFLNKVQGLNQGALWKRATAGRAQAHKFRTYQLRGMINQHAPQQQQNWEQYRIRVPDQRTRVPDQRTAIKKVFSTGEQCVVCLDRRCTTVFAPCGHYSTCSECAARLSKCPICRVPITAKVPHPRPRQQQQQRNRSKTTSDLD